MGLCFISFNISRIRVLTSCLTRYFFLILSIESHPTLNLFAPWHTCPVLRIKHTDTRDTESQNYAGNCHCHTSVIQFSEKLILKIEKIFSAISFQDNRSFFFFRETLKKYFSNFITLFSYLQDWTSKLVLISQIEDSWTDTPTNHVSLQINSGTHQHQTVTDSPYAKPNKATKSSQSPLPGEGTQTRVHITETHTTHLYQPGESQSLKQNQLDSMLGNLQADMSRQGVNTTQKGCCSACEKPIVGQVAVSYIS